MNTRQLALIFLAGIFISLGCSFEKNSPVVPSSSLAGNDSLPECQWCGAMDAPAELRSKVIIAEQNESGERISIRGKVFHPDGLTPAPNIILYLYHTNAKGLYEKKGDETGNGRRHGYLRAWIETDSTGQYQFETIKPMPYPNNAEPAHIHITLTGDSFSEYYIDPFLFEDDPLLKEEKIISQDSFSHILRLKRNNEGILEGFRHIKLR